MDHSESREREMSNTDDCRAREVDRRRDEEDPVWRRDETGVVEGRRRRVGERSMEFGLGVVVPELGGESSAGSLETKEEMIPCIEGIIDSLFPCADDLGVVTPGVCTLDYSNLSMSNQSRRSTPTLTARSSTILLRGPLLPVRL